MTDVISTPAAIPAPTPTATVKKTGRTDELNRLSVVEQQQICSHDAPGQKKGTACVRCGKAL